MSEAPGPRSNPIVDEFLRPSRVLELNRVDLSNMHNLYCVINSLDEAELSGGLEVFNFEHCQLSHKNIEAFYAALSKNIKTAFHLSLSWNKLGAKGMVPMRKLFTPSVNISRLYLDGNDIGNMGLQALLRALEVGKARITHLSLDLNNIGTAGMMWLANNFSVSLGSITWLSLSQNDMSGEDVAESVAKALMSSETLTDLNISSTRLGSSGVSSISYHLVSKNRYLKCLDLTNNDMRDMGAHSLSLAMQVNNVLSRLRIGSNSIGPSGCASFVEGLHSNESLKELDLSRTHHNQVALGVEGARQIAHLLQVNRGITDLNLYWCNVESAGALLLASALEDNMTISKINLGGNYIGPAAVRKLEECMSPLYQPGNNSSGLSAWDSKVPSTPLLLNRKTRLAARRPQSASALMTRRTVIGSPKATSTTPPVRKTRDTINVNSRKSVLIKSPIFARSESALAPKPPPVRVLFDIKPKMPSESTAILPSIRQTLISVDSLVARNKAIEKASPDVLLRRKEGWMSDGLPKENKLIMRSQTSIDLMFQM